MQPLQLLQHALHSMPAALMAHTGTSNSPLTPAIVPDLPTFAFSEHWQLLGPFQIGTREAAWGADPLEQYGGFRNLTFDGCPRVPSSLPSNGTASWSVATATLGGPDIPSASAELSVGYPDVDWAFLQQVYGWVAGQWQGWARGEIIVQRDDAITLILNVENVLEYWIDDKQYFGGDFYGFRRTPPVLHLDPGAHRVDVRLVRDVRAMGGITDKPTVNIKLELQASSGDLQQDGKVLIADHIEEPTGLLASDLASVVLRNNAYEDFWIESVQIPPVLRNICKTSMVNTTPVKIAAGQTRPIAFRLACVPGIPLVQRFDFDFIYYKRSRKQEKLQLRVEGRPRSVQDRHKPHKLAYLHLGGMVSYAILRPPSVSATGNCKATSDKLPVLLALHGAGLEADDELVMHALDPLPDLCAWVLFPTGVTPWSGDDWHVWGSADVEAAVNAIPQWIKHTSWNGPGVDTERWLVTGHSNGGQGTWHILTHHPDKIIAAAPLSGYSSIQNYVPYDFWRVSDPRKAAIVHASLGSYRHELLLGNTKGIPIMQQHGSADDNVPAYHSRLMHQLLSQSGSGSTYHEMEGKPHYWDGVMSTQPLADFLQRQLAHEADTDHGFARGHDFAVVTMNPTDTGSSHGIRILGLSTPGQLARIEVTTDNAICRLHTSNVQFFEFTPHRVDCLAISIDDNEAITIPKNLTIVKVSRTADDSWKLSEDETEEPTQSRTRHGRQLGAADSILRTNEAFQIVPHTSSPHHAKAAEHTALQISRNLCQYYAADTELSANYSEAVSRRAGNIISVFLGVEVPHHHLSANTEDEQARHAITAHASHISVLDSQGSKHTYRPRSHGLAAIYLRPLPNERLELVVWGVDEASLRLAARLVPMMTGVGVPDFVIGDSRMLWKGVEGTLAMGFLDDDWQVSVNAVLG